MTINLYRVDLVGLSTESKPTAQINGTTYYEVDTMKFYIWYKGEWYLQEETEETNETDDTKENNSDQR